MLTLLQSSSPTLTGLLNDGSVRLLRQGARFLPTLTLISRRACVFRRVPLSGRTSAARKAAALKVQQELQFSAPRTFVSPDRDGSNHAGVWTWDTSAGDTRSREERALRSGVASLPETIARAGIDRGRRLVRCLEGVEGEVWTNGVMIASRWWPESPSAQEWALFVRSARGAAVDSNDLVVGPPPVEEPVWLDGFPPIQADPEAIATSASPLRLAAGIAIIALAFGAFEVARLGVVSLHASALEARIEKGGEANARLAALRRSAQARNAEAAGLSNIGDERRVIDTLGAAITALPKEQLQLRRATFAIDELEIEALVRGPVDGPALVARLEKEEAIIEAYVENADIDRLMRIRIGTSSPPVPTASAGGS